MGKKVLFIGDIHGNTEWRELALEGLKRFQEVVFLGDYMDSFHVSPVLQLDNLKALIAFLRNKPKNGKITALWGNHDYAYLHSYSSISGYQHNQAYIYREIFDKNRDLFNIAWGYTGDNGKYTLASHAGLTYRFWKNHVFPLFDEGGFLYQITEGRGLDSLELHEVLNYLVDKKELMWKVGSMRRGGGTPSPLWADYMELLEDPYPDINQVFGHTAKPSISLDQFGEYFVACIDSWGNKKIASMVISL
jgi:hypothetical protein